jgi:hypothetical protein
MFGGGFGGQLPAPVWDGSRLDLSRLTEPTPLAGGNGYVAIATVPDENVLAEIPLAATTVTFRVGP